MTPRAALSILGWTLVVAVMLYATILGTDAGAWYLDGVRIR